MPDIKIASLEGSEFGAYLATPSVGRGAGLVVVQEVFGVNASMRKLCDDYAAQGYIALCPELFWRQHPNMQLNDRTPEDLVRASDFLKGFDIEAAVRDLISTLGHIRKIKGCNGKVGVIGHGLGGRLAYLMATRSDVDAAVAYYPTDLDKNIDEMCDVSMPLLFHFAALDKYMPIDERLKILHSAARNPIIMARVYEDTGHSFALAGGQNYNKEAAELAESRTKEFLTLGLMSRP
jgi:carboxymethylenebutenolidase